MDDSFVVRRHLSQFLTAAGHQVLEAGCEEEGLNMVKTARPKVLVLDLRLLRRHGLEALRQLRKEQPDTRILLLCTLDDAPRVMEALRHGASGCVLKAAAAAELVKAVQLLAAGNRYLSPALAERVVIGHLESPGMAERDVYERLTQRERIVLPLAAAGMTSAQVAGKLFIQPSTAETHRANLMRKLNLRSQTDLVQFAVRKGILSA